MLLQRISLGLFIIPSATIFLCLWIVIYLNILEICNPFISGCYSISRVGRSYPAILIFKPMMVITIVLMIVYFFEHYRIFKKFLINKIYLNLILLSGLISSFALFIYIIGSINTNVIPTGTRNLGSSGNRWDTVYANTFDGNTRVTTTDLQTGNLLVTGIATVNGFFRPSVGSGADKGIYWATNPRKKNQAKITTAPRLINNAYARTKPL